MPWITLAVMSQTMDYHSNASLAHPIIVLDWLYTPLQIRILGIR